MGTDRRIAASALRKAAAIEAWLDAGIAAGDLRHEGLGAAAFDPALQPTGPPEAGGTAAASVRPIVVPAAPAAAGAPAGRPRASCARPSGSPARRWRASRRSRPGWPAD